MGVSADRWIGERDTAGRMVRMEDEALTQKIMGCAMAVHRALGPGFLELWAESLQFKRKNRTYRPKATRHSQTGGGAFAAGGNNDPRTRAAGNPVESR